MTNMLFYMLLLSLSASFMNGAMRYSGVNRTFLLLQRGILEYSVVTVNENVDPYYNQTLLKQAVDDYFETNLTRYVKHYTTGIYYINSDESICINGYCQKVNISLKAHINFFFDFDKALMFSIYSLGDTSYE